MIDGGHIDDQLAGRALNALTAEEQVAVDKHVTTCGPCQDLLIAAQETAHMLALVAQPISPPRYCRARIMAAIERDQFLTRPGSRRNVAASWAVMGAVMLALLAWNVRLQQQLARQSQMQDMVIGDPQPAALKPRGDAPGGAAGRMFKAADGHEALLVIENLQPAPSGKVYQIWVANEKAQQSVDTFQVQHRRETLMMHPKLPLKTFKWVMVTVENAGGSQVPSDHTVLFGDL